MDGLEVDGDVVDGEEERSGKNEGEGAHDPDNTVLEDSDRNHGTLTLDVTGDGPDNGDGNPANKKTNDNRRVPSMSLATVLDSEDVRDGKTHHQNNAKGIHLKELLKERSLDRDRSTRSLEEDEDDDSRDTSDGKVDVETPSPRDVIGESTTQERTDNTGDTVGSTDDTGKSRSFLGRSREPDDGVSSGTETGTTNAGDGTAGDEGFGIGSGATDDGAELEDENGDDERCLEREVLVDFTPFGGVSGESRLKRGLADFDLQVDWKAPTVMKKAAPYHPTLSRPLNSSVILGIAVATMV